MSFLEFDDTEVGEPQVEEPAAEADEVQGPPTLVIPPLQSWRLRSLCKEEKK